MYNFETLPHKLSPHVTNTTYIGVFSHLMQQRVRHYLDIAALLLPIMYVNGLTLPVCVYSHLMHQRAHY